MKLSISTKSDAIKDSTGGDFLGVKEDIYPVTINFVSVSTTTNGAKQVDFNVNYKGKDSVIYGPIVINKDEKQNEIGMQLLNKLGVIAGLGEGYDLNIETETHTVGKENKEQEFEVITDFSGLEIELRLQREYSKNPKNNEIRRDLRIRNVFRADGATAAEIAADGEVGKQRAIELEKYCQAPSYKDVTEAEVTEWEAKQRASRGGNAAPASTVTEKKTSMFGKKAS
jgi:hypothetical protein